MRSVVIIPARYQSTRFPGKPLVNLLGKPMILWVAELSSGVVGTDNTYVATDDERIAAVVKNAGFNVVMTTDAPTGTDRVAEAAKQIKADIYLNIQGDEPLLDPKDILNILKKKEQYPNDIINGYCRMGSEENPSSVNIPKVIFTKDERLVYMSRLPIPGLKELGRKNTMYHKQVCIYAFNYEQLLGYQQFGKNSVIEECEDIEILRFLELGKTIRMVQTTSNSFAVDVPEDVPVVEKELTKRDIL